MLRNYEMEPYYLNNMSYLIQYVTLKTLISVVLLFVAVLFSLTTEE